MRGLKRFSASHRYGDPPETTLRGALAAARAFADENGLDRETGARLMIVVEELVANVLTHGAVPPELALRLDLETVGEGVAIFIEDTGRAFDPRDVPEPLAPRGDRGGGVGLALVRAWCDVRSYEGRAGVNRLWLVLRSGGRPSLP